MMTKRELISQLSNPARQADEYVPIASLINIVRILDESDGHVHICVTGSVLHSFFLDHPDLLEAALFYNCLKVQERVEI